MFRYILLIALFALPIVAQSQSVSTITAEDSDKESNVADLPFYSTNKGKIDGKTAKKLVQKGDKVYDQMGYADAAQYYEIVAEYNEGQNPPILLEKLGNCYYFISNFENAYKWYHQLFLSHKNTMSNKTLYRYGQSLKGVEKYTQASRIFEMVNSSDSEGLERLIHSKKINSDNNISLKPLDGNSENSDFSPTYLGDDKLVFASARELPSLTSRKYGWNNQPFLDLYIGDINMETSDLNNIKRFSGKVNSKYHEAGAAFTPDGQTMFFTRNNFGKKLKRDANGVNHLTLYMSKYAGGEWSKPIPLPFNGDDFSTGHPAVSPDGKRLFFTSDMPGGFGETDIYVVDINGDGTFTEPKNLGRGINSNQKEMFPFITEKSIYFSSDRKLGLGGLDIYKSSCQEGVFDVPINLGSPINSSADDFSYIMDEKSKKGYFASNRKGGKGDDDIYAFKYLVVDEVTSTLLLGVVIEESSGRATGNVPVTLLDAQGNFLKKAITDNFGSFQFENLMPNTSYEVRAEKEGYEKEIKNIETQNNSELTVNLILRDDKSSIVVDGNVPMLQTSVVYFDFDKYVLRKEARDELKEIIKVWESFPNMVIKIESHTDSRGSKIYNRILSQKRADATKNYLLELGLEENNIESAIGYGEVKLLNDCADNVPCDKGQHEKNRRSNLIITDY